MQCQHQPSKEFCFESNCWVLMMLVFLIVLISRHYHGNFQRDNTSNSISLKHILIDQRSLMFTVWGQKLPTKDFSDPPEGGLDLVVGPSVSSVSYLGAGLILSLIWVRVMMYVVF